MNTQPEALRLADILQKWEYATDVKDMNDAATELRRLHEVNQELLEVLKELRQALLFANENPGRGINDTIWMMDRPETLFDFIDAAIDKAEGSHAGS